jgi:hypothetical protein
MSTTDAADRLRQRATELRRFAAAIQSAEALQLGTLAGVDTWIGPTPDSCRADIAAMRTDLLGAVGELRATARRFDQQAGELAALPDPHGPR